MCDIVVVQSAEIIQAKYFISNIKNTVKPVEAGTMVLESVRPAH